MRTIIGRGFLVAATLLATLGASPVRAQDVSLPTIEEVTARLLALENSTAPDRAASQTAYQQALESLQRAEESRTRSKAFQLESAEAPALLQTVREELVRPPSEPALEAGPTLSLDDLEIQLEQARSGLASARAKVTELKKLAEHRTKRKSELPVEISEAQELHSAAREALDAVAQGPENEARRTLLLAQVAEHRATLEQLEAERDTHEARRELLPLRRDRAARRLNLAETVATFWQTQVDKKRQAEGEAAAREAEQQLAAISRRFPALEELATKNRELASLRSGDDGLPKRITRAMSDKEATRLLLRETRIRFSAAGRRISAGGLTESMGLILRRDYDWLPEQASLRSELSNREKALSEAQLQLITIEEDRARLGDLTTAAENLLSSLDAQTPSDQIRRVATGLLTTQRESQDAALSDLSILTTTLYDHEELERELLEAVRTYREFIEKRILWVRSSTPNPLGSLLAIPTHIGELAQEAQASFAVEELRSTMLDRMSQCSLMGIALVFLFGFRRLLKRTRVEMGVRVRSFRTDKYRYTLRALAQTLLIALPIPLLAWSLGWVLSESPVDLLHVAGLGLRDISQVWLTLAFLRGLFTEKGVGGAHFRWPANTLTTVRKELRWFVPLAVSLGFVVFTLERHGVARWSDSIGRFCFVIVMVALATCSHRLLRASSALWSNSPQAGTGLLGKTHRVWSLVATVLPLALALLASLGFYYTALQFELLLRYSIAFAIVLVLVNALLLRWLFITRRRLAVSQALEAKARREEEAKAEGEAEATTALLDTDQVDIPAVDAQTRQLFKSSITLAAVLGLYFIWASTLPALQGLDRIQFLPALAIVATESELSTDAEQAALGTQPGSSSPTPGAVPLAPMPDSNDAPEPSSVSASGLPAVLTLADVLLVLIFVLLTHLAARNLPALLELSLLQRLPLDSGSRYAVSTILRYLILLIGVSAISKTVGIGWEQIQWLAAALTFGLAFGLQEIFANFVSGVIILIERPIRVGDIVTVGSREGRITQLRMRATTILDWDRREHLVPNKEFITGSIVNWTLSDPVTRLIVEVGIAYGSDTELARKLLLQTAKKNKLVLDEPPPQVVFRKFGDSSLNFELRVFIANRDVWPQLINQLHTQIDNAFRAAEIEIAFPQRDVHIRSASEDKPAKAELEGGGKK